MIIYDLMCDADHGFEGWFKNAEDYTQQLATGLVICPICGSEQVQKIPTASHVSIAAVDVSKKVSLKQVGRQRYTKEMVKQLYDYVEQNFDDVGKRFAEEAKKIHSGEVEGHNIRGQATREEVRELEKRGIQTVTLPPKPIDKEKLN